jgi:ABC-type transport system involved in cytochrome bd biosynthesis fused ATPase/permease subunit
MRFCNERTIVFHDTEKGRESTMNIKEIHMKIIAIGLIPIFLILAIALPDTTSKTILLGGIMITALVVSLIGMSMAKKDAKDAKEPDDLLAIPPKKS